jgi:peptidoglycan/LPS O-acetylase OafA/YrhL
MPLARHRLDVIDGLRGVAIVIVVCYHAWLILGQRLELQVAGVTLSLQFVAVTGFLGVDLFFFLSGFCLFYPYARRHLEGGRESTLGYFASRRALKIVPSYVLALTVFALVYHDKFGSWGNDATHYAAHLFFVHTWFASTFDSISGPFWTLGIEVQFYLIFPLIAGSLRTRPVTTFLGILVLATSYRLALIATAHADSFYAVNQLPAFIDIFVSGMAAAYIVVWARMRHPQVVAQQRTTAAAISAVLITAACYALFEVAQSPVMQSTGAFFEWQSRYRPTFAIVLIAIAVCSTLATENWQKVLANPFLLFFSAISYNLYLWHVEIFYWCHNLNLAPWLVNLISLACALAAATLTTYALEQPILTGGWRKFCARLTHAAVDAPCPLDLGEGSMVGGVSHALARPQPEVAEAREAFEDYAVHAVR